MPSTLLLAAGLGAVSGLRSMTGVAMLSRELSHRRRRGRSGLLRMLTTPPTASLLAVAAAGELMADKLPMIPARISPLPLAGRAAMGAAAGAAVAQSRRDSAVAGALIGGVAAVAGAFAGYHARRMAGQRLSLPDGVVAAAEDGVALTAAATLSRGV